jgi:hypothetical protein
VSLLTGLKKPFRAAAVFGRLWWVHGIAPFRSVVDFLRFRSRIGVGLADFFHCRLWDRTIPMADRLLFLAKLERHGLQFVMNPKSEEGVIRDKALGSRRMSEAGVRTTQVLAVVSPSGEFGADHRMVRTKEQLGALISEGHPQGLVCKPSSGTHGSDVQVFSDARLDSLRHLDGSPWTLDRLWALLSEPAQISRPFQASSAWLLEQRVAPHRELRAIHGDTLGCVRVVVLRFEDGDMALLDPCLKIPIGAGGVDNLSFGTLITSVDLESGRTGRAMRLETATDHEHHPETGVFLEGIEVPFWTETKQLALRAMSAFPGQRSIGFDIGISDDGPVIIEANSAWAVWMMQSPHRKGLVRGHFLRFLEELGAEDVIRRKARRLPESLT